MAIQYPETEQEKILASILSGILGNKQIGVDDNFFESGGHSLLATMAIAHINDRLQVQVSLQEFFNHPTIAGLSELIAQKTGQVKEQAAYTPCSLCSLRKEQTDELNAAYAQEVEDIYPLSPAQELVLGLNVLLKKKGLDWQYFSCVIEGEFSISVFQSSWQIVCCNHPILRTAFRWRGYTKPIQIVLQEILLPHTELDWSNLESAQQAKAYSDYLEKEKARGFEITHAPLFRITTVRLNDRQFRFIWFFLNSLIDGFSMSLIFREALDYYQSLMQETEFCFKPSPALALYIRWLGDQDRTGCISFWKEMFSGYHAADFPDKEQSPARMDEYLPADLRITLSPGEMKAIRAFTEKNNITTGALFHGVWLLALAEKCHSRDILAATITSGRTAPVKGINEMAGLFASALPFRMRIEKGMLIADWLKTVQEKLIMICEYEYATINEISRWGLVPVNILQEAVHNRAIIFFNPPVTVDKAKQDFALSIRDTENKAGLNIEMRLFIILDNPAGFLFHFNAAHFSRMEINARLSKLKEILLKMLTVGVTSDDILPEWST